jgi:sugar-specific transcriptional regulator TrmB
MPHDIHFPILKKLGLSESEALIYELLIESGKSKARILVEKSGLGRGNVYNVLEELEKIGLITTYKGKQQQYEAIDPARLKKLLDKKKDDLNRLKADFNVSLSQLSSAFNLSTGRPAIQVFEGYDGFEEALNDSLSSKTEILTYFDPAAVTGKIAEINKKYVQKRRVKGIVKRIILPDNKEAKSLLEEIGTELTKIRLANNFSGHFMTAMEIYDNKVTFLTLDPNKIISVILEDQNIAKLQRAQFEALWGSAEDLGGSPL